jgi:hypothetical protein
MISMNIVSHNGNVAHDDIIKVLGCTNVGENVAYNYTTLCIKCMVVSVT